MVPDDIVGELNVLKEKFKALRMEWSLRLRKHRHLFERDPSRTLLHIFIYGRSTSYNMYLSLYHVLAYGDTQLDLLIEKVHDSIPNFDIYSETAYKSKKQLEIEFLGCNEFECFFELYWEQWEHVLQVRRLFFELAKVSISRTSSSHNPIDIIENWAPMCERYPLLHSGFYGDDLTDRLLEVLTFSGLKCEKKYFEKFDFEYFLVKKISQLGNKVVGAYIHYQGVMEVHPRFLLLCLLARAYDDRVVLIVNIKSSFSSKVMDKLIDVITRNKFFTDLHRRSTSILDCSFKINGGSDRFMPATVMFVSHHNHSYKKYARCF